MWEIIHTEHRGELGYGPAVIFYFVCVLILFAVGEFVVLPAAKSLTSHHAVTASHDAN
jgi:hypothetical protein